MSLDPRPLGRTGLRVSPLGLSGSFGIDADSVVRAHEELGVNYFYVTPTMRGMVEGVRRLVRAGRRDRLVIAGGASVPVGASVVLEWEALARRLGVETIDVWHLFWVQARWYVTGRTWPAMLGLKAAGKARALAISCHDRPMARRLVDELGLDALMIRYNAAHRGAEREVFATLAAERPGIVAYTATRWGRLLAPAGGRAGLTAPECYRFVLGHPSVDVALCGAASWDELCADAAGVAAGPLPAPRMDEARAFGDAVRATARDRLSLWGS